MLMLKVQVILAQSVSLLLCVVDGFLLFTDTAHEIITPELNCEKEDARSKPSEAANCVIGHECSKANLCSVDDVSLQEDTPKEMSCFNVFQKSNFEFGVIPLVHRTFIVV